MAIWSWIKKGVRSAVRRFVPVVGHVKTGIEKVGKGIGKTAGGIRSALNWVENTAKTGYDKLGNIPVVGDMVKAGIDTAIQSPQGQKIMDLYQQGRGLADNVLNTASQLGDNLQNVAQNPSLSNLRRLHRQAVEGATSAMSQAREIRVGLGGNNRMVHPSNM